MVYRLKQALRVFRIADSRYPIFDGTGAMLRGARWNSPGRRVIYACTSYAGALLEVLVHASGYVPKHQAYIEITIPSGTAAEDVAPEQMPDWHARSYRSSRSYGDQWYDEKRSLVLLVPSVVTRVERNILIHQGHPDFRKLRASEPLPVRWNERLWKRNP